MPEQNFEYEDVRYSIKNPIARRLHSRFDYVLEELIKTTKAKSVHEIGCGEGFILRRIIEILQPETAYGGDVSEYWLERAKRNLGDLAELSLLNVENLPFDDGKFDLVTCIEVLEHVDNPKAGIEEIARVTTEWAIVSVPNRYLWRFGNLSRFKYFSSGGNTPGHINEWTKGQFRRFVEPYFDIIEHHTPFPWQIALLRKK